MRGDDLFCLNSLRHMPSARVARNAPFLFPNGLISQGLSPSELKSRQKLALSRKFFFPSGFDIFRKLFCLETTSFANRLSNLSTPPFDHLSVICHHLADTCPDQTWVNLPGSLSRRQGRKREQYTNGCSLCSSWFLYIFIINPVIRLCRYFIHYNIVFSLLILIFSN